MRLVMIVLCIVFVLSLSAIIINIPEDFDSIQEGLNFASEGDTILVAEGIYVENLTWPETNSLKLVGSNENNCIIDGDSLSTVIYFGYELNGIIGLSTLIKDFTIRNGYYGYGGGISCDNSSPSLQNLILTNNYAYDYGGGVACFNNSNPNLVNLLIINNLAYYGGGIYCYFSNPSIYDVQINNNSAQAGAGIYCENSSPNIENVTISSNSANSGGGIYCCYSSNPNLENVMISDNSSNNGAGICCQGSDPSLVNVILTGNSASRGGGMFCESSSNPNLENVTINNNTAYNGGGIYCWFNSFPIFSSENRSNIYLNTITNNRGAGSDIFIYETGSSVIEVFVDTFTVMTPTDYYASPINNFSFDILHSVEDSLIYSDVYVSVEGDNSNNGTSPETPFKTIKFALSRIYSDSISTNTIHLSAGIYSPTTNGESFPIRWSNYLNLSGIGEDETILDADSTAGVMEFLSVSNAFIENLTITGGSAHDGGGIYCRDHSSPSFKNIMIIGNSALYFGGGVYCYNNSNPSFTNVSIINNSATGSAASGGGICCNDNSNPALTNVTIANNSAIGPGGSSEKGGGICCRGGSNPSIVNCILWNDIPQEIYFQSASYPNSITISYSDIQGGETEIAINNNGTVNWLEGNIDNDPLFVDAINSDYHLSENSPCIDAGNPNYPFDPDGTITDMGAYYYNQLNSINESEIQFVEYHLSNYPNPFNPSTTIDFSIQNDSNIQLEIFNIKGQKIKTVANNQYEKGNHSIVWNGVNDKNKPVSSGIYLYKLNVNGKTEAMKKCLLLK
jgi:predicted outer membrane repeat protein